MLLSQEDASDPFKLNFKEVQKDIYLGYRPNSLRNPVVGNIVIINTDRDVILFDAGRTPSCGQQVVEKIKEITSNPVSYIIVSHGHIDHIGGLSVYMKNFPDAEIISRQQTRDYIETRVNPNRYIESLNRTISQRDSLFEYLRLTKDRAIVDFDRDYYYKDAGLLIQQYKKTDILLPSLIFSGEELKLYRKDMTIIILWFGHGKTRSDIALYIPDNKLIVTGDMVTYPVPYGFCSEPEKWAETLRRFLELDVTHFIPGHGSELCDREYVEKVADLLDSTATRVKQLQSEGLSEQEIINSLSLTEYTKYFTQKDVIKINRFHDWYLSPIVNRLINRE